MKIRTTKRVTALTLAAVLTAVLLSGCGEKATTYSTGLDAEGMISGVKATDYVEVPAAQGISIPKESSTVSDEDVQAEIDTMLISFASAEKVTDRAVKDGDTVNIDYVGSVDGTEFEGGSTGGKGTDVTIGVTQYIDDFLEQLIGHKPGDSFDVNVTFPPNYTNASLSEKDAVFKTTINYIAGEKVQPELNDAFVVQNLQAQYSWSTVEEMKAGIREKLEKTTKSTYIEQYLLDSSTFKKDVPAAAVEFFRQGMKAQCEATAAQYGVTVEELLTQGQTGVTTMDELLAQNEEQFQSSAKRMMAIQAVSETVGIKVTDADIQTYFEEQMGTGDYSQYKETLGVPYLKMVVREYQTMKYLQDNATQE